MKSISKAVVVAALMIGASQAALHAQTAPAPAPVAAAPTGIVAQGIGVVNIEAVRANSNAVKLADQQREVTYKATIDAAKTRAQQIDTQLKGLAAKIEADRKAPKPVVAMIEAEIAQAQQLQQAGQQEVNRILGPVTQSQAYVEEQVNGQLGPAISAVMTENKVTLLLNPQAVLVATSKAYDLNLAVLTKLNALIPAAQLVPPVGWQPREVREQQAAQAGAAPAPAAPAAPGTTPKPSGR